VARPPCHGVSRADRGVHGDGASRDTPATAHATRHADRAPGDEEVAARGTVDGHGAAHGDDIAVDPALDSHRSAKRVEVVVNDLVATDRYVIALEWFSRESLRWCQCDQQGQPHQQALHYP